jgi:hypothetical protein
LDPNPSRGEKVRQVIADFIRQESRKGRLVPQQEALDLVLSAKSVEEKGESPDSIAALLGEAAERNRDLKQLLDLSGNPHYYSNLFMTAAYAHILMSREGDPLALVAEIVRENSAIYPRPVPLETFMQPPFEMTEEEIRACLARMAGQEELGDISQTTTSAGTLFLYSRLHLEPGHAAMLAERLDLGPLLDP